MKKGTAKKASEESIAIIGGGNIGQAIARGLATSGKFAPGQIIITRRQAGLLRHLALDGFVTMSDNREATRRAKTVLISVLPQQLDGVLREIGPGLIPGRHLVISIVTGATTDEIASQIKKKIPLIRAMPNLAIVIGESMTCIASKTASPREIEAAMEIFNTVGKTLLLNEEDMVPATALCACGVAFFLRSIRSASQGGIEIGFHSDDALLMAAQTAKGSAALILEQGSHPEAEIDKVTSPRGCTISGLNEMEHMGFSSAMIKGITTASEKAAKLYQREGRER
ncbi:MAG: pyrroline-5-carboxylate reductase [Candidatus Eremiobacteraeota bacterium]|nr:pyrroline-5-carboxylate reductase [Candidatus Eremiobacteraeota bacterium]